MVYIAVSNMAMAIRVEMALRRMIEENVFESFALFVLLIATSRIPTVLIPIMAKRMK
jgi:hypothetical protein